MNGVSFIRVTALEVSIVLLSLIVCFATALCIGWNVRVTTQLLQTQMGLKERTAQGVYYRTMGTIGAGRL